jgi:hypothetical protein
MLSLQTRASGISLPCPWLAGLGPQAAPKMRRDYSMGARSEKGTQRALLHVWQRRPLSASLVWKGVFISILSAGSFTPSCGSRLAEGRRLGMLGHFRSTPPRVPASMIPGIKIPARTGSPEGQLDRKVGSIMSNSCAPAVVMGCRQAGTEGKGN